MQLLFHLSSLFINAYVLYIIITLLYLFAYWVLQESSPLLCLCVLFFFFIILFRFLSHHIRLHFVLESVDYTVVTLHITSSHPPPPRPTAPSTYSTTYTSHFITLTQRVKNKKLALPLENE